MHHERIWRPFTQMKTAAPALKVNRGLGASLYLEDGSRIIDAISSWWVITHGHCHPRIVEAIREQVTKLDQVIFAGFSHEPAEAMVECLLRLAPEFGHVFFSDNGSTAVEVALKMVLQAAAQEGQPQRNRFIAFNEAYHGDTVGAMSAGGRGVFNDPYSEMLFEVVHARQGYHSDDPLVVWLDDFKEKLDRYGSTIAGVIFEPLIQGAGGMIMWPAQAVSEIVRLTREAGARVIFDEVMTGFGRTGSLFAYQQLDLTPDVLCLSKGLTAGTLPLSVTLASADVYQAFYSDERKHMFFHGHSFTGNPISCAAARANLELITEDRQGIEGHWRRIEQTHHTHISQLREQGRVGQEPGGGPTGPVLRDARVCGLVAALAFHSERPGYLSSFAPIITKMGRQRGVLLRPLGNVVYLLPPYCISDDDLALCWDTVMECVAVVEKGMGD